MPLAERDPNTSGRTSRASNMSAGSRNVPKGPSGGRHSDLLFSAPGISSMMRTSTEFGNVGGIGNDTSSFANVHRPHHRSGASSRMSTGSSHSNNSRRESRRTSAQQNVWPGAPPPARHSMPRNSNMPQYVPDTLSPTIMNLPGSSPLVPRSRQRDDGSRSRSMTHTSHPNFALATNRSYSSLRSTVDMQLQRPRSPYDGYPQHFRRPNSMRPVSPATSDFTDAPQKHWHGHQNQQGRMSRVPSDLSVRQDLRSQMVHPQTVHPQMVPHHGPPLRSRSPAKSHRAYYANPDEHADVPPVPPIPLRHLQHMATPHGRIIHRQAKGSESSGSTNPRAASETPSSDGPSPPTPKDGASMGILVSPTGTQLLIDSGMRPADIDQVGLDYYDGSEEFYEKEEYVEEVDTFRTGYGYGIKTIVEERVSVETPPNQIVLGAPNERVDIPATVVEGIAELPASPVPRRITREMVLSVIGGPGSSTDGADMSARSLGEQKKANEASGRKENGENMAGVATKELVMEGGGPEGTEHNRYSVVSHAATSLMNSSTVELAVRYSSSPGINGTLTGTGNGSTGDGISDLLAGYEHTEEKDTNEIFEKEPHSNEATDKQSSHTPKSSDARSFKSCTDTAEQEQELPRKDSDGTSFRTCKVAVTPDRAVSMPPERLPSSILGKSESSKLQGSVSERPLSSPPTTVLRKKPPVPLRDSSFPKMTARMRANSKLSSRQGSTVTSISSSVEGTGHQTPVVPPRESSASKEAQRSNAVASYLLRGFRGGRFSSLAKKSNKGDASSQPDMNDDATQTDCPQDRREASATPKSMYESVEAIKTPERAITHQDVISDRQFPGAVSPRTSVEPNVGTPAQMLDMQTARNASDRPLSTPSAAIPEPSSVYSSDNNSSLFNTRAQSSPVDFYKSPEDSRRDSQSTTHLAWHPRTSLGVRPSNLPELHHRLSLDQDDNTTTDLRYSSYGRPMQMHYLPDLKEESHEDSSLHTSTSNLKNSSFRFPHGGQRSVRASVDDALLFGRNPSLKSVLNSNLARTRGLPSMNFSQMDLVGNIKDLFDKRSTRSFDACSDERPDLTNEGLARSMSDGGVREKYKSVFGCLEGSEKMDATQTTAMDLAAFKRRYTTREIMSDIEKLDVPSVNGLTQRLSEMFPSIKPNENGEFPEEQEIMQHAMEELNSLEVVGGPAPKRSSARLRPVPGSPNMVVVEDALYEELTGGEKEGSGGETDVEVKSGGGLSPDSAAGVKGRARARTREKTPLAELEAPCAAKLRPRSLSLGDRPSSRLSLRRSQLSLPSTPTASTDTNPWYNDKNFPWATTTIPSIDISLPAPATLRGSPRLGPSPLRIDLSESSEASPSFPAGTAHVTSASGEARKHRLSRFSRDNNNNHLTPTPPLFDTQGFLIGPINVRGSDRSHEAGDRYPTSSLSPPSDVNISNLQPQPATARLSESDDGLATPRKRKLSLLNRLTSTRTSARISQPEDPAARCISATSFQDGNDINNPAFTSAKSSRRLTFNNATGMSRSTFKMQQFKIKMKSQWAKVKELFNRNKMPDISPDPAAPHNVEKNRAKYGMHGVYIPPKNQSVWEKYRNRNRVIA